MLEDFHPHRIHNNNGILVIFDHIKRNFGYNIATKKITYANMSVRIDDTRVIFGTKTFTLGKFGAIQTYNRLEMYDKSVRYQVNGEFGYKDNYYPHECGIYGDLVYVVNNDVHNEECDENGTIIYVYNYKTGLLVNTFKPYPLFKYFVFTDSPSSRASHY